MLVSVTRRAMGCEFEIIGCGSDERLLEDAANSALDEVERLDQLLSSYIEWSHLNWVNAHAANPPVGGPVGGPVAVDPDLFALLRLAKQLHRDTSGAFDVTVGALVECWRHYAEELKVLPPPAVLEEARQRVGLQLVELDEDERTVRFLREGVEIDLGGIGKGYAIDRAAALLRSVGVEAASLHAGRSSIYALGAPPGEEGWGVGLLDPLDPEKRCGSVTLRDRSLSTSGQANRFFELDGRRYGHILDPRTGWPVDELWSAAALGPSAALCDGLSTAFLVMGIEATRRYCARRDNVEAILIPPIHRPEGPKAPTALGEDLNIIRFGTDHEGGSTDGR